MLKYTEAKVTFQEIPNEITLCINISNCPCNCEGCHSAYLSQDIGTPLTIKEVSNLIKLNNGITCVAFMGGDADPILVNNLASYISHHYPLKIGWYSGRAELSPDITISNFDYIKLGPYNQELGPLSSRTTNQRFYKVKKDKIFSSLEDITNIFWK